MARVPKKQLYAKTAVSGLLVMGFGCYLLYRSSKPMSAFDHHEGIITYLGDSYQSYHHAKSKFLKINTYDRVYKIFVGNETGDFSPDFENINALKPGDTISVFYDTTPLQKNREPDLDSGAQFITKKNKLYFRRGSKDKYGAMILIPAGLLIIVLGILQSRKQS